MQFGSPGSVQSSSRLPVVSWYQSGNPLVSSIGPTRLRPTVPLLCAGGGVTATATRVPEAANATAAAPAVTALRRLRRRSDTFMRSPWDVTVGAGWHFLVVRGITLSRAGRGNLGMATRLRTDVLGDPGDALVRGGLVDPHLTELGPVAPGNLGVHDPGRLGEVAGQGVLRGPEVRRRHVRGSGVAVAEGLDQDVLRGVVEAARPVEPQEALLRARGLGELAGDLGPGVGVLGPDAELGGDEDQRDSSGSGAPEPRAPGDPGRPAVGCRQVPRRVRRRGRRTARDGRRG